MRRIAVFTLAALALSPVTGAAALELRMPVECVLGDTCFIQNYVDHDSGPAARDMACEARTYDGHKGTDFALPSVRAMHAEVAVVAAASGVVTGMRDGMDDIASDDPGAPSVDGRECGNGVVLSAGDGVKLQYCHLKKGTLRVKKGDKIAAGDVLGAVGMSGRAEFPHLHFQVTRDDKPLDPFTGETLGKPCGSGGSDLWSGDDLRYQAGAISAAGIVAAPPSYKDVKTDAPHADALSNGAEALVFWGHFHGVAKGDRLRTVLRGPGGTVLAKADHAMTKPRAAEFRFVGKRRPEGGWPSGRYQGEATLLRDGKVVVKRRMRTEIR